MMLAFQFTACAGGHAMRHLRIVVHGRVQGVGYRAWLAEEARRRGIEGWARNRTNGTVEAVLGGADAAIDQLLAVCREGPPAAQVTDIEMHRADAASAALRPAGTLFGVLPTL